MDDGLAVIRGASLPHREQQCARGPIPPLRALHSVHEAEWRKGHKAQSGTNSLAVARSESARVGNNEGGPHEAYVQAPRLFQSDGLSHISIDSRYVHSPLYSYMSRGVNKIRMNLHTRAHDDDF